MLIGICSIDGTIVNALSVINLAFNVFQISIFTWYYHLSTCAQAIIYTFFTIKLFIDFFSNLKTLKTQNLVYIKENTNYLMKCFLIYLFVTMMLNNVKLESIAYFTLFGYGIIKLICDITSIKCLNAPITLEYVLTTPAMQLIKYLVIVLSTLFFGSNCVEGIINGLSLLKYIQWDSGNAVISVLYENLFFEIIILIFLIKAINLCIAFFDGRDNIGYWKEFMIFAIVVVVIDLGVYIGITTQGSFSIEIIKNYLLATKTKILSLLLICVSGFITVNANKD